jgi:hypothetical protein
MTQKNYKTQTGNDVYDDLSKGSYNNCYVKWLEISLEKTNDSLQKKSTQYSNLKKKIESEDPLSSKAIKICDFRIGFEYEEYQMDNNRYFNQGMIWVKKVYDLNSPRLSKIQLLIDKESVRKN